MSSNHKSDLRQAFTHLEARHDSHLKEYFYATDSIKALCRPQGATIAVGMKGTGKSSAFRYLTEFDESQDVTVAISPRTHILRLEQTNLKYAACANQFEADIVIDALGQIDKRRPLLELRSRTLLGLDVQLKNATKVIHNYRAAFKRQLARFTGASLLGFGFSLAKSENDLMLGLQRKELAGADTVLKAICNAGLKVRIVVDDPENIFSTTRELDTHLIGGLCLAAMEVNRYAENLKLILLLKTHVYSPVIKQIEDIYPKYPSQSTYLTWDPESLAELVRRRLTWLSRGSTPVRKSELLELFDKPTEVEATSALARMTGIVRNGPRDLIYWIDRALENAENRSRIREADIDNVIGDVSTRSFIELETAYDEQCPGLGDLIRIIFRDKNEFATKDFLKHVEHLSVTDATFRRLKDHRWLQELPPEKVPAKLCQVGAVGFESGGRRFLPYMRGYDPANFAIADKVYLCPILTSALERRI